MRKIELKGFKSFAERTTIDLVQGLTCVVGPNGSGKSNITDAIRWVLGEQKVKTLRGSKMEDVIFNGTHRRAALGVAEVALHFSNEDRKFPIDFSEIVLARRLYRSGESEYLINDTPCRLKDVRDLFTDTGIGTEGYSLIGQGRIESIISGNSDERRLIFEEAAGIVKYKQKKREAMKKLDNTELNLMRLEDLSMELKSRLVPLEKESEKAKSFVSLSESLRTIEVAVFLSDYDKLTTKLDKVLLDYDQVISEKTNLETTLSDRKEHLTLLEEALAIMDSEWQSLEEERLKLSNEDKTLDGDLALWDEKLRSAESENSRLQEALNQEHGEENALVVELQALTGADTALVRDLKRQLEIVQANQKASDEKSEVLRSHEHKAAVLRSDVIAIIAKIERAESEIRHKNEYKNHLEKRISELESESKSLKSQLEAVEVRLSETKNEIQDKYVKREGLALKEKIAEQEMSHHVQALKILENEKRQKELERNKASAEKEALENLEKNFEGYDLSVKRLMHDLNAHPGIQGVFGVLAERIKVDPGFETALEVALGRNAQNVICENENVAKTLIQRLKAKQLGRVTFLPLDLIGKNNSAPTEISGMVGFVGMADRLVKADESIRPALNHLIGRTAVFDTYDHAVAAYKKTGARQRLVTLQGEVFNPNGSITGGSKQNQSLGLLSRKNRIDTIQANIEKILAEEQQLDEKERVIHENLNAAKAIRIDLQQRFSSLDNALAELQFHERTLEEDKKRLLDRDGRIRQENEEQLANVSSIIDENEILQRQSIEWRSASVDSEATVILLDQKVIIYRSENDALVNAFNEAKIEAASLDQKLSGIRREKKRIEEALERSRERVLTSRDRIEVLELERAETIKLKAATFDRKIDLRWMLQKLEERRLEIASERESHKAQVIDVRNLSEVSAHELESRREQLHQVEMMRERYLMERETLLSQMRDKYDIEINEAREKVIEIDLAVAQVQTKSLRNKLKTLGDVQISSIKEFEEVSERYTFMRTQMDDLIQGEQALKKVIRELDHTMKQQFKERFSQIGTAFEHTFKRLFNGGTAELRLNDPMDPLETDIDIYVQPPGKKLQHLHLLSGGEKALTAIGLLFAILEVKPAPFCVLDEIEAALDDVNVDRFAQYLKDISDQAQFVVITHRKGTMEIADALYGVTMEEYGISRVVSVKLEEIAVS